MGKLVKSLKERMLKMWRKLYVAAKGLFLRFSRGVWGMGLGQMLMCDCHGSFLANFCVRERKPRYFSSETAFCLLVALFAKAFVYNGCEDIWIMLAGHWSFPAGHLTENLVLERIFGHERIRQT